MPRIASPPTVLRELDGPDTCEMCGTPGLKTELVRDPFIYGAGDDGVELVVDIPVRTCSSCGPYTDDEAEDIRHDEVCRHLGVLTPTEIRDLRAKYGLSRAELARISGLGESSIARWETREIIQNVANDRHLRLLQDPAIFLRAKSFASLEPVMTDGTAPPIVKWRCTACWGDARLSASESGTVTRIECGLCTSSLSNDAALAEWGAMEREATQNLAEIARGRTPEYRPAAKFVAKIIADMPRDEVHWDMRAEQALRLPAKEGRTYFLTRDTIPAGEAGYLYLQAKLLAAAARSLPFETAIHRWDELDLAGPLKLRIDRLDESGIHLDVDVASRADPGTWEERAGALMMRGLMAAFSCEVALKAILMTRCHRAKRIHDVQELYSDLPEDSRARLEADYTDIGNVLREPGKIFHESRYFQNPASVKEAIERGLHHERIHDLEKAARVILDECEMSGLEGRLISRPQATWTGNLGRKAPAGDFQEGIRFTAESGESAFVWRRRTPDDSDSR